MIDALILVVHAALVLHAIVRSAAARFPLGLFGGFVRLLVLVLGAAHAARSHGGGGGLPALAAALAGPLMTFVVCFVAYGRTTSGPGAPNEDVSGPLKAWLLVAAVDLLAVATAIAQRALADW